MSAEAADGGRDSFPGYIELIREVTDDENYKNSSLAKI